MCTLFCLVTGQVRTSTSPPATPRLRQPLGFQTTGSGSLSEPKGLVFSPHPRTSKSPWCFLSRKKKKQTNSNSLGFNESNCLGFSRFLSPECFSRFRGASCGPRSSQTSTSFNMRPVGARADSEIRLWESNGVWRLSGKEDSPNFNQNFVL